MQENCVICASNSKRSDVLGGTVDSYDIVCDQCGSYVISITAYGATNRWHQIDRDKFSKALRFFNDRGDPQSVDDVPSSALSILSKYEEQMALEQAAWEEAKQMLDDDFNEMKKIVEATEPTKRHEVFGDLLAKKYAEAHEHWNQRLNTNQNDPQ